MSDTPSGSLVAHHRAVQLARLDEVVERFGEGPNVRQRRRWLESDELLSADNLDGLLRDGEQDRERAVEQERLRGDYLLWREEEAKRLAKLKGFIARHRTGHDAFLATVDRGALRRCSRCEEIAYPDPERKPRPGGRRHVPGAAISAGRGR